MELERTPGGKDATAENREANKLFLASDPG